MQWLWYVAYGSKVSLQRFQVYLQGGTPVGGAWVYLGARDPVGPVQDVPVLIRGGLRFVGLGWRDGHL